MATDEAGLGMSEEFLEDNPSWVREGAYLVIIFLSDEEGHTPGRDPANQALAREPGTSYRG